MECTKDGDGFWGRSNMTLATPEYQVVLDGILSYAKRQNY
jgi:hypothetical protein